MTQAFEGIKMLDFTQVIAGPMATYQLALLGAEVIKVEALGTGDMCRHSTQLSLASNNSRPLSSALASTSALSGEPQSGTSLEVLRPSSNKPTL